MVLVGKRKKVRCSTRCALACTVCTRSVGQPPCTGTTNLVAADRPYASVELTGRVLLVSERNKQLAQINDTQDYNFLVYKLLKWGDSDIYTTNDSDLIHSTAKQMREVTKLVLNLLVMVRCEPMPGLGQLHDVSEYVVT